jgi:1,4-dihydroxy-2-naphthoate octaprenyltransferase
LGRQASRWEYYLLVGGSYLILVGLVILRVAPPYLLLALLTLPSAIDLIRTAAIHDAPARLNKLVRGTAKLHERFGWLMILGVIVAIAAQVA